MLCKVLYLGQWHRIVQICLHIQIVWSGPLLSSELIIITGDETWVHYFGPLKKDSNKIRATKNNIRSVIAKCTLSAKMILYVIFFSDESVAVPVKKDKSITGKYYNNMVLKK